MTNYPAISFKELIQRLERLGFEPIRQRGSHIRFAHPDNRRTTVPDHGQKDVPKGLLYKIIKHDLEMDLEDFFKMFN